MPKNQPVTENEMVVTDKGFLLVPVDRPHWIFRGKCGLYTGIYGRPFVMNRDNKCANNKCVKKFVIELVSNFPTSKETCSGLFRILIP